MSHKIESKITTVKATTYPLAGGRNKLFIKKKIATENNITISTNEETKIKLHSGLTVAQLSYFSNLLLKSDIIKTENQSEVFQFMATNFKTNMTDKISPESFRSKYYNVEETTKHFVREKIIDLLNLTKT